MKEEIDMHGIQSPENALIESVPGIVHFINTGDKFPYMYYLSIMSAIKVQKPDRVILWLYKTPTGIWFEHIKKFVECRMVSAPDKLQTMQIDDTYGFKNPDHVRASTTKNIIQNQVVLEYGGMFMDMDCFSLREAWSLYRGKPCVVPCNMDLTSCENPINNSFLLADKNDDVVRQFVDLSLDILKQDTIRFGETGCDLYSTVVKRNVSAVTLIDVHKILGGDNEFLQYICGQKEYTETELRIIHLWTLAHYVKWDQLKDPSNLRDISPAFESMVKSILTKEEYDPQSCIQSVSAFNGNRYKTLEGVLKKRKPLRIVEVGVFDGSNACWMIQKSERPPEEIEYFGFDLFRKMSREELIVEQQNHDGASSKEQVYDKLTALGVKSIHLFSGYTRDSIPQALASQELYGKVDLIYIDGGHCPITVENDWKLLQPVIDTDTVIVFDDYNTDNLKGSQFVVDQIMGDKNWKAVIDTIGDGMTHQVVVRKRNEIPIVGRLQGMRFHLPGLAHLPTTVENSACAYTQKVIRLAKMLRAEGGYVMFYGVEGSHVECDEYNVVLSQTEWSKDFGDYDRSTMFFRHGFQYQATNTFNNNMIKTVNMCKQPRDFILLPMGGYHMPVAEATGLMAVESGIGYGNTCTNFLVFETYTWMMHVYGLQKRSAGAYHTVIPNCYGVEEFPFIDKKDDYFVYLGRVTSDKGVNIALEVAKRLGSKLLIVGQGDFITSEHLKGYPRIERLPAVGPVRRAELLGHAKGVFVPTQYIEPFGGVAVEAMMCGTPVITSDFGAFPETVHHGVTGYRCSILRDYLEAARNIEQINPKDCRDWAVRKFSLEVGQDLYAKYFQRLYTLWTEGWYAE